MYLFYQYCFFHFTILYVGLTYIAYVDVYFSVTRFKLVVKFYPCAVLVARFSQQKNIIEATSTSLLSIYIVNGTFEFSYFAPMGHSDSKVVEEFFFQKLNGILVFVETICILRGNYPKLEYFNSKRYIKCQPVDHN